MKDHNGKPLHSHAVEGSLIVWAALLLWPLTLLASWIVGKRKQ